jgi:hypothetical protein
VPDGWQAFPWRTKIVATHRQAIGILDAEMPDATPQLDAARMCDGFIPRAASINKHKRSLPIKHPIVHGSLRLVKEECAASPNRCNDSRILVKKRLP